MKVKDGPPSEHIERYRTRRRRLCSKGGATGCFSGPPLRMKDGSYQFSGDQIRELRRLDRVLSQVARPVPSEAWAAPLGASELLGLGLYASGSLDQKALVERLWGRKRTLLRAIEPDPDGGLMPPVA